MDFHLGDKATRKKKKNLNTHEKSQRVDLEPIKRELPKCNENNKPLDVNVTASIISLRVI